MTPNVRVFSDGRYDGFLEGNKCWLGKEERISGEKVSQGLDIRIHPQQFDDRRRTL